MIQNQPTDETERELEALILHTAIRWASEGCPLEGSNYLQLRKASQDLYWIRRRGK